MSMNTTTKGPRLGLAAFWQALFAFLVIAAPALGLSAAGALASSQEPMAERSQHIFLLDHSTAMLAQQGDMTRWEKGLRSMNSILEALPTDGSVDATVLVFNHSVPGRPAGGTKEESWEFTYQPWRKESLGELAFQLLNVGSPTRGESPERSALWNAIGRAMNLADGVSRKHASRWIHLYAHGVDDASAKVPNDRRSFDSGTAGQSQVEDEWRRMAAQLTGTCLVVHVFSEASAALKSTEMEPANVNVRLVRIDEGPVAILDVKQVGAARATSPMTQSLRLATQILGPGRNRLQTDTALTLSFEAQGAKIAPTPQDFPLREGIQSIALTSRGAMPRAGVLRLSMMSRLDNAQLVHPTNLHVILAVAPSEAPSSSTPVEANVEPAPATPELGPIDRPSTAADYATSGESSLRLLFGSRRFSDEWAPIESQACFGGVYSTRLEDSALHFEMGASISEAKDRLSDGISLIDASLQSLEGYGGFRLPVLQPEDSEGWMFSVSGGLSMQRVEVEIVNVFDGGFARESKVAPGFYAGADFGMQFDKGISLGLSFRKVFGAEVEILGVDAEFEYDFIGGYAGMAF
jgi:hypothetical protein